MKKDTKQKNQKTEPTKEQIELLIKWKRRNTIILMVGIPILIAIVIIGIIARLNIINQAPEDNIIDCIVERTKLYTTRTCGHCQTQKDIFGKHKNKFDIIDCASETEKCKGIISVPSWLVKGEIYSGVKNWEFLRTITEC